MLENVGDIRARWRKVGRIIVKADAVNEEINHMSESIRVVMVLHNLLSVAMEYVFANRTYNADTILVDMKIVVENLPIPSEEEKRLIHKIDDLRKMLFAEGLLW